jgi:2-methylisocitrate lyase-like PEP mutase family enzyme
MTVRQADKGARFRALHEASGVFVMPNPWDAGSARVLAGLGFAALATSSGASAGTLGRRDGRVTRTEALAHARGIVGGDRPAGLGIRGKSFTVAELEAAGVRRVSLATSLYRAAMTGLLTAAREVKDRGTFGYLDTACRRRS